MELEKKCLRWSLWLVGVALVLRLCSSDVFAAFLQKPEVLSLIFFTQTGRYVNLETADTQPPPVTTTPQQEQEKAEEPEKEEEPEFTEEETEEANPDYTVFNKDDAVLVEVNSYCGYDVDVFSLLQKPLTWELTGKDPTVLIVHSHGSESYKNTEKYKESSAYRTLDKKYNMVSVGTALAKRLEEMGIGVVHDTTLHDYPSYNQSYTQSRKAVKAYLEKYPTIRLVLDLHRDAVTKSDGTQAGYTVKVDGKKAAKVMLVVGTDASGRNHPNWQENMAMAVKLHAQLEKEAAGICRPISFRRQRFNQDLSKGAVIVEVGAAGNTRQEALNAIEVLAKSIGALAHGTAGELS